MCLKLMLSLCFLLALVSQIQTIQVETENGKIEGQTHVLNGKEVHSFIGIPFAEPPLGDLRFRKPISKSSKFDGIYNATEIKAQCVSPFNTSDNMSEDCLYLNVWTAGSLKNANKPVMFWIYGGSYFMGSAYKMVDGYYIFNGTQLALRDVVIVTSNYRLGVFGYLYGGSKEAPGNMGHWDQYQALVWVKENIKAFGGNPDDITLFGVSAGSSSVSAHVISPISRKMFSKGIMQSGSISLGDMSKSTQEALSLSKEFAQNWLYFPKNACSNDQWIQCLKNKTSEELNTAQMLFFYANFQNIVPFKPVFGDEFMPKSGIKSLKESDFKTDVKLLIGHSIMEGVSFARDTDEAVDMGGRYNPSVLSIVTKEQIYEDIKRFIPADNETLSKVAAAYTLGFPSNVSSSNISKELIQSAAHAFGDAAITCSTVLFGSQLVKSTAFTGTVHQYRLTYANSKSLSFGSPWAEAEHTDEQPLVFGRPLNELSNNWTTDDTKISEVFLKIWTDFAKTGKPTLFGDRQWPQYDLRGDGQVNLSCVDLNPFLNNSQQIRTNRYRGNDGFTPNVINNCVEFWSHLLVDSYDSNFSFSIHSINLLSKYIFIIFLLLKHFIL